jgi:putative peptidoglycan lipid II flippase
LSAGRHIALAAIIIASGNMLSRLLGFVREPVIAALFGATGATDAFEVATRLPTMIFDVAIGGAISAVLVPVFTSIHHDKRASADLLLSICICVLIFASAMVLILSIFAEQLISLVAADFPPETHNLAVMMTRITLPAVLLLSLSAIVSGRLYAAKKFAFPAFSISAMNATLIVAALALTPLIGPPGVAVGYLAGAIAHLGIQLPGLANTGIHILRPRLLANPHLRQAINLYLPVVAGLIFAQMIVLIDTRLAASSGEGSLAMMRFATRLQQFPLGVVVTAVTLATLPVLSQAAPQRFANLALSNEFRRLLGLTTRYLLLLIIPLAIIMIGLNESIIRLVYLRGAFLEDNVAPTAHALLIYSVQLPFVAVDQLFIFAYYAARNTRTPVVVGIATGMLYIAVALATVNQLGFHGLVWANTAQNSCHALVLGVLLWRATGMSSFRPHLQFAVGLSTASALAIGILLLLKHLLGNSEEGLGLLNLSLVFAGTLLVYVVTIRIFGVQEAKDLVHQLRAFLNRFQPRNA